jgi:hypothetical protein
MFNLSVVRHVTCNHLKGSEWRDRLKVLPNECEHTYHQKPHDVPGHVCGGTAMFAITL